MPQDELQRRARRRAWLIIAPLLTVGLLSIALHISLGTDYTVNDALFDLGKECLTAAVFFVLLDQAIGRYEERQQMRSEVLSRLRGDDDSKTLLLNQLASGTHISGLNLSDSSMTLSFELEDKVLTSCQLDRCDMDSSAFNRCTFKNVSLRNSSLRLIVIESTKFEGANFNGSDMTGALFINCSFDAACTFEDCALSEVRFNKCTFNEAVLKTMQPAGATFNSCEGIDAESTSFLTSLGAAVTPIANEVRH